MAFVEVEFPRTISYKAMGGPAFNTTVNEGKPGFEQRNQNWSTARGKWTVSVMTPGQTTVAPQTFIDQLEAFFLVCAGRANGFRLKDHKDYTNGSAAQSLGPGDGLTGQWQLIKKYSIGGGLFSYTRTITKPMTSLVIDYLGNSLTDTIGVVVNGNTQTFSPGYVGSSTAQYTVDQTSGVINFRTYGVVNVTAIAVTSTTATYTYNSTGGNATGDTIIRLNEQVVVAGTGAPSNNDGTFIVTAIGAGTFTVALTTQIAGTISAGATATVRATKLVITGVTHSGSNNTYAYSSSTGQTVTNGMRVTVAGFVTNPTNNGVFYIQSNVPGVSFTVVNAAGVTETHAATGFTDWVPQTAATITATYSFHFPVRFDTDELAIQVEESDINDGHPIVTWNSIVLRELRLQITNGVSQG